MLEKVKEHLKKHKTAYLVTVGTVAGVALGAVVTAVIQKNPQVINKPVQILTWKSKQTIEVYIEALGDPGNIIQDNTTGSIYASQGQAARELGLNPARLSEHLNGTRDQVAGRTFTRLGKAPVSA